MSDTVKAISMGLCMLIIFAALCFAWVVGGAVVFVFGRWCAMLMGWY